VFPSESLTKNALCTKAHSVLVLVGEKQDSADEDEWVEALMNYHLPGVFMKSLISGKLWHYSKWYE